MAIKPNVLIFGGINALTPLLASYLVPLNGDPLVGHLRIADKYSISPPTVYVSKAFPQLVKERANFVEYRQANLTSPAAVSKCFTDPAPNGRPYTHVFDFSGELSYDRPAEVQISHTLKVSLTIARAATQHGVKAYVRNIPPVYDHETDKRQYKESDPESWRPFGVRGVWWHETIRAVGSIPNLPFVVLREALSYGPGQARGDVAICTTLAQIYKHLNQDLKAPWSPRLKKSTIHVQDVVKATWAASQWAATMDRAQINALAGVAVPPSGDKSVASVAEAIGTGNVTVPVFNLADETDTDQNALLGTVASVFGMKHGFHNDIINLLIKMKLNDVAAEANELHIRTWADLFSNQSASSSTPLSPFLYPHQFEKRGYSLDGDKLRKVVGYTSQHPRLTTEGLKSTVEWFQSEGIWPH